VGTKPSTLMTKSGVAGVPGPEMVGPGSPKDVYVGDIVITLGDCHMRVARNEGRKHE
jgi:hypothetical protein